MKRLSSTASDFVVAALAALGAIIVGLSFAVAVFLFRSWLFMLAFNAFVPGVFGIGRLSFGAAVGLVLTYITLTTGITKPTVVTKAPAKP